MVCNEISAANLDRTKDFITVIPDNKFNDINYVSDALAKNREVSLSKREEIRKYALETFSWKNVIQNQYLKTIQDLV